MLIYLMQNTAINLTTEDEVFVKDMNNEGQKGGKLTCLFQVSHL